MSLCMPFPFPMLLENFRRTYTIEGLKPCIGPEKGRTNLNRKQARTFQFDALLPAGQLPDERKSTALHALDLHKICEWGRSICSRASPPAFVCCPFGWAGMIAVPGALSPCFQRDEIWQSPFVLYIDNNPFVSENRKGP